MEAFKKLKDMTLIEIISKGCEYAVDKEGFTSFAIDNWNRDRADIVRAVVCAVKILHEGGAKAKHELHVLDFVFNNSKNHSDDLITPLMSFFDDKKLSLSRRFIKSVNNYNEMSELYSQLQFLEHSTLHPLIKSIDMCKLMSYDKKEVFICVTDKDKNLKSGVFRVHLHGKNACNMKVKFGTNITPLVGVERGVVSILDPNSLETIYQNHYLNSDRYSKIQKTGFIYGVDEAKEYYARRVSELTKEENDSFEEPQLN